MTNSFPERAADFTAFRTPADQAKLARERSAATKEGRQVLALEMIADQLGSIARQLGAGEPTPGSSDLERQQLVNDAEQEDQTEQMPEGIERTLVETFTVGEYQYTNREHAVEEARRARKRMASSSTGSVPE